MAKHNLIDLTRESETETEQSPKKKVKTGNSGRSKPQSRKTRNSRGKPKSPAIKIEEDEEDEAILVAADIPEDEAEDDLIQALTFEEQWNRAKEAFHGGMPRPSRDLRMRFEEQHKLALELHTKHGWRIMPMQLSGRVSLETHIEQQNCSIYRVIYKRVEELWDKHVDEGDQDERKKMRRKDQRSEALAWVAMYGLIHLPGETKPSVNMMERAKKLGFTGGHPGLPGEWHWQTMLGATAKAHAGLWVQANFAGEIIRKVAVKENWLNHQLPEDEDRGNGWDNAEMWDGPLENRYPMEVSMMDTLRECENSDSIVKCQGHGIYDYQKMFRIYMEFCAHGSLEGLIEKHYDAKRRIPVRFIWATFEAMAEALCLMKNGCLPGREKAVENDDGFELERKPWDPMRHQDVKPDNIFLAAAPEDDVWHKLPRSKLGDYGTAYLESFAIAHKIFGKGTPPYWAPEMDTQQERPEYREGAKISPASDLWAVGRIILAMINLEPIHTVQQVSFGDEMPRVSDLAAVHYPDHRLLDLAEECVREEPNDRISAEELWREIRKRTRGMRHAKAPIMELPTLHKPDVHTKLGVTTAAPGLFS